MDNLEDLLKGQFKQALKNQGFMMRLAKPVIRPNSSDTTGLLASVEMGFVILRKTKLTSEDDIRTAQNESYNIVKSIVARIILDSRNRHNLFNGSLNQLLEGQFTDEEIEFQGDGTWAGHIMIFQFKTEYIDCIETEVKITNWKDR